MALHVCSQVNVALVLKVFHVYKSQSHVSVQYMAFHLRALADC